jgi:urease accessory protein
MLTLTSVVARGEPAETTASVTLSYDQRRRARLRTRLDDGTDVGLVLPRGLLLKDGDRLRSEDGTKVVLVRAAVEELSCASTHDSHLLLRATYHLGNRHVALQLEPRRLLYQHDHVLDGLMRELGLDVTGLKAPFEPEPGAYGHEESVSRAGHHDHDHGHHHR